MPNFVDYQNEIYFASLSGVVPSFPMRFEELEARATVGKLALLP